ncbi:NmrA/HSCARG family protein [Anaeromyxobacter oryzisoli]|uniref:NmrA/HSCARG family protein n=1 Tax=Anaeromyxobacter oryzisoli TaxID=2925408 RepID=UPI001F59CDBF|nr:NmrA/HSCARG family protein [Anaeromyxobacter sp. SG63]
MPFAYYQRLSRRAQAVYRRSDAITSVAVPGVAALHPHVAALRAALDAGDGAAIARASFAICAGVCRALGAAPPRLEIHAVRPRGATHELHGLYAPAVDGPPVIRVWMRTARHARVVAFRTFLRTLLHEVLHHLDLEVLGLEASFHTEGFFKRESSLFHQLVPEATREAGDPGSTRGAAGPPRTRDLRGTRRAAPATAIGSVGSGKEVAMPKPITVAVAGGTGTQGGAVARLLLQRGHAVRALTRRPGSAAAAELRALGADVRQADLDDVEAVRRALAGADAFFAMATPYEAGVDAEIRQGRRAADAAREAGVKHLVYSSVASADQETGIPHFDSKAEIEAHVRELGVPYTIVGPVFFMENLIGPWFVAELRAGTLALPLPPSRPLQMIAVEDIARFVGVVLERPDEFRDRRVDIASDSLTGPEMARILAEVSGRDVDFVQASLDPVRRRSTDLARMWEWFDQVGYGVDVERLVRTYPEVGWHDFRHWAREQDWSILDVAGPEQPTA